MARLYKVDYRDDHMDYMSTYNEGGVPPKSPPSHVYELRVAGTTLVFINEQQVREAEAYFSKKLRPLTGGPNPPYEHYWHVWYGRLPKGVLKRTNREKIQKALSNGIAEFFDD
ncbi:MAG: hypothetical protein AAF089_14335 [Bacteroidota bacterium]